MRLLLSTIALIMTICSSAFAAVDSSTDTMTVRYSDMLQLRENIIQLGSEKLAYQLIADECVADLNTCQLKHDSCMNTIVYEGASTNNYHLPWYVWLSIGAGPAITLGASLEDIMLGQGFDKRYVVYGAIGMAAGIVIGYGIDRLIEAVGD